MITRLDIKSPLIHENIVELLKKVGSVYPQGIIFQLLVASKSSSQKRTKSALRLISTLRKKSGEIVKQTAIISEELNKVAILLEEEWHDAIQEAVSYFITKNYDAVCAILLKLHTKMKREPRSQNEICFYQKFESLYKQAEQYLRLYKMYLDPMFMYQAISIYWNLRNVHKENIDGTTQIHLKNVSPKLTKLNNSQVAIPGSFDPNKQTITISGFYGILRCINSKRKPRKMQMYGHDGKVYDFLLKGHEDLRQDERVMQLLSLVNTLLNKDDVTEKKNLEIVTFPVIPLSTNTGLLGWVNNCDTLQELITDYRKSNHILQGGERTLMKNLCPCYDKLSIAKKVEVFRHIMDHSKGEDVQKVLWFKSNSAEVWLQKRTNFTRSLATMSIVGYILGLGDRHLSNLMM